MDLLPAIEHNPEGPVTGSIVWLHGLGASGHDFVPVIPHLGLPGVRYVFPHAPDAPVTINGGYVMPSWYDIRSLDHTSPDREDPDGVRAAAEHVRRLVAREVERGVPEDRIVLAGFSQGAATALYTALRHPRPLLGAIVLSGYLVLDRTLDAEITPAARRTPMLFCHGTRDAVVPVEGGRASFRAVSERGVPAEWHDWPIGHELGGEEVRVIRRWLHERFGTASPAV